MEKSNNNNHIYFNDEWNEDKEKPNRAHYDDDKIYFREGLLN